MRLKVVFLVKNIEKVYRQTAFALVKSNCTPMGEAHFIQKVWGIPFLHSEKDNVHTAGYEKTQKCKEDNQ